MGTFNKEALILRIKTWAYECLDVINKLKDSPENRVISFQLAKSCLSSLANYRAACRAKSIADMINKLKIVEEELDESKMWLETIQDRNEEINCNELIKEADELLSIIVSSIKTLRKRKNS
jgi:four helix bundle protein